MTRLFETQVDGAEVHDRMFGLDLCRTLAVATVVFGHLFLYSLPHDYVVAVGFTAIFGVDLFFCLSGFLIGRILLQESSKWSTEKDRGVLRFWYRRWMRTVPLYLFFFLVELQTYWGGASSIGGQSLYLLFAQNLAWPMTNFYRLTWSLAVEEWFYFLFPLVILFGMGLGKSPRVAVFITITIFLIVPPMLRYIMFDAQGIFNNLDPNIRHIVIFRLDSIGFGVLIAYIDRWHKPLFQKIVDIWWIFAILAFGCMMFIKWEYFGMSASKNMVMIYFTFSSIVFAGLIPFFSRLSPTRFKIFNRFVKYTSLISYSLYLGHILSFTLGVYMLKQFNIFESIYPNPWIVYPLFLALAYLLGSFTYFLIEKPLLMLRDRKNPFKSKKVNSVPVVV